MLRGLWPTVSIVALSLIALAFCASAGANDLMPPVGQGVGVAQTRLVVENGAVGSGPYQLVGYAHGAKDFKLIPNANYTMQFGPSVAVATFPSASTLGGQPGPPEVLFHAGATLPDLSGLSLDIPSSNETAQAGSDRVIDSLPNGFRFIAPINQPTTDPSTFFVFSDYFGPTKIAPSSWVLAESQNDTRVFAIDANGVPNQTPIFQLAQPRLPTDRTDASFARLDASIRHSLSRLNERTLTTLERTVEDREETLQLNLARSFAYYDFKVMSLASAIVLSDGTKLVREKRVMVRIGKTLKAEAHTLKLLWPNR